MVMGALFLSDEGRDGLLECYLISRPRRAPIRTDSRYCRSADRDLDNASSAGATATVISRPCTEIVEQTSDIIGRTLTTIGTTFASIR
jgi:hypothetical protein